MKIKGKVGILRVLNISNFQFGGTCQCFCEHSCALALCHSSVRVRMWFIINSEIICKTISLEGRCR